MPQPELASPPEAWPSVLLEEARSTSSEPWIARSRTSVVATWSCVLAQPSRCTVGAATVAPVEAAAAVGAAASRPLPASASNAVSQTSVGSTLRGLAHQALVVDAADARACPPWRCGSWATVLKVAVALQRRRPSPRPGSARPWRSGSGRCAWRSGCGEHVAATAITAARQARRARRRSGCSRRPTPRRGGRCDGRRLTGLMPAAPSASPAATVWRDGSSPMRAPLASRRAERRRRRDREDGRGRRARSTSPALVSRDRRAAPRRPGGRRAGPCRSRSTAGSPRRARDELGAAAVPDRRERAREEAGVPTPTARLVTPAEVAVDARLSGRRRSFSGATMRAPARTRSGRCPRA